MNKTILPNVLCGPTLISTYVKAMDMRVRKKRPTPRLVSFWGHQVDLI